MDQIAELTRAVQETIEAYAKGGWAKARGYTIVDAKRHIYTVIGIPDYPRKFPASIVVMARIENDKVIIEHDISDRPLWEELVRVGIPREKIVLTYAGEQLPAAS
jgi:hypothetical protein